ncbi:hypothetical protein ScPMuIL_011788 [Solemya velum]
MYEDATSACQDVGASLVSVNNEAEQNYISNWLTNTDVSRSEWLTSGVYIDDRLKWEGDGTLALETEVQQWWLSPPINDQLRTHIAYKYSATENRYGWVKITGIDETNYICEIPISDTNMVIESQRDFDYGIEVSDLNNIPRGPSFIVTPNNLVVIGTGAMIHLDCVANGKPQPSYHWYKNDTKLSSADDDRYTFTSGRFSIESPSRNIDSDSYQCQTENEFGSILSDPVLISFGYLMEFSNQPPGSVEAILYQGTFLNCNPPAHNPAVKYGWFRDATRNFVRPELNLYLFLSANGNLYFSEVQQTDHGTYHCVVTLSGRPGDVVSSAQAPSHTGMGINLIVKSQAASDYAATIHNDFIAVFPPNPKWGQRIRMECLAYGRLPLYYSWTREDRPFSSRVHFEDINRVLIIEDAQISDQGHYTCHVGQGSQATVRKSITLTIGAQPFFVFPLRNMHMDKGSSLTWRCEAMAQPRAQYTWYKNSQILNITNGDVEITANVLQIRVLDERHAGMYQCAASNIHGTTLSSGQLRVLAFEPNFRKHAMEEKTYVMENGNAVLPCQPEGAPLPELMWSKNGADLNLIPGREDRLQQMLEGDLKIMQASKNDEGTYVCTATNELGSGSTSTELIVLNTVTISQPPQNTVVIINETAFMYCDASTQDRRYDLVYEWHFNGYKLDLESSAYFVMGTRQNVKGLYIRRASFKHMGTYECHVRTVFGEVSRSAYLTVKGPPGEPAGIYADELSVSTTSMMLKWTMGSNHGNPADAVIIKAATNYYPDVWKIVAPDVRLDLTRTQDFSRSSKNQFLVDGLTPYTGYSFRIFARNIYGIGEPSLPSAIYQTQKFHPVKPPSRVGGGNGKTGTLVITWDALDPGDFGADGFGYNVYWRLLSEDRNEKWQSAKKIGNIANHTVTVGNYYLKYQVKVGAYNEMGSGPNSTEVVIFSAEGMPAAVPQNINGQELNATAIWVSWNRIPSTRDAMMGKVKGYQISYYDDSNPNRLATLSSRTVVYGDVIGGLVIGLEPDSDYWFSVQVFNSAGLGTKSEKIRLSTYTNAPLKYPEFVNVSSNGPNSVAVRWRGVSTGLTEEPLQGYKLRWWPANDNIQKAKDVVTGKVTYGVIEGIQKNLVYKLRVLAYSAGGDGALSPTVYFTMGGHVPIIDPATSMFVAAGNTVSLSRTIILSTFLLYFTHHIL